LLAANYTQNITLKTCCIELELGVDFKSTQLHPEAGKTMRFGERIRELRKEKGMDAARGRRSVLESISRTYRKSETGGIPYTPAVKTIRQLAEVLR